MDNLKVGDLVSFQVDGESVIDKITHLDKDAIIGEKYDLTSKNIMKIKSEEEIDKEARDLIDNANLKAEEFFYERAKQYPEIYSENRKEAFMVFFLSGYIQGYTKSNN